MVDGGTETPGKLLGVQVGALHLQRQPVVAQIVEQDAALVDGRDICFAGIIVRVDPHVAKHGRLRPSRRDGFTRIRDGHHGIVDPRRLRAPPTIQRGPAPLRRYGRSSIARWRDLPAHDRRRARTPTGCRTVLRSLLRPRRPQPTAATPSTRSAARRPAVRPPGDAGLPPRRWSRVPARSGCVEARPHQVCAALVDAAGDARRHAHHLPRVDLGPQ